MNLVPLLGHRGGQWAPAPSSLAPCGRDLDHVPQTLRPGVAWFCHAHTLGCGGGDEASARAGQCRRWPWLSRCRFRGGSRATWAPGSWASEAGRGAPCPCWSRAPRPYSHAFCVTLDHRQESASLQQTAPRATRGSLAPLPGLPRPCKPGALIRLPARSRRGGGVPLPAGTVGSWPATDTLGSGRLLRHSSCRFSVAAQGGATQGGGFCQQSEGPVASKPHSVMS